MFARQVPKFYINFQYRDYVSNDDQGLDLPNLPAAVEVAVNTILEFVDVALKQGGDAIPKALIVADQDRKTLATISIVDILAKRKLS
jgi:hypothetical protein